MCRPVWPVPFGVAVRDLHPAGLRAVKDVHHDLPPAAGDDSGLGAEPLCVLHRPASSSRAFAATSRMTRDKGDGVPGRQRTAEHVEFAGHSDSCPPEDLAGSAARSPVRSRRVRQGAVGRAAPVSAVNPRRDRTAAVDWRPGGRDDRPHGRRGEMCRAWRANTPSGRRSPTERLSAVVLRQELQRMASNERDLLPDQRAQPRPPP